MLSKKMAQVTTSKLNSNDETFTAGFYNGFSILIRDNDEYVNATKLVQQINQKENKKKLKSFFKGSDFGELKDELLAKLKETGTGKILSVLRYGLKDGYSQYFYGTYVHPKLVKAIAMWTSVKYLLTVSEIMDNIIIQAQLLEKDGNEYLHQTILEQNEKIKLLQSENNNLTRLLSIMKKEWFQKSINNIIT
jgi:hypothetical protein